MSISYFFVCRATCSSASRYFSKEIPLLYGISWYGIGYIVCTIWYMVCTQYMVYGILDCSYCLYWSIPLTILHFDSYGHLPYPLPSQSYRAWLPFWLLIRRLRWSYVRLHNHRWFLVHEPVLSWTCTTCFSWFAVCLWIKNTTSCCYFYSSPHSYICQKTSPCSHQFSRSFSSLLLP